LGRLTPKLSRALLFLCGGLLWTTSGVACSVSSLDGLIAEAVTMSRQYWIASILVGALLICLEVYQKRRSIVLFLTTVALLAFHPHLTIHAFPAPSCEFMSVQASQAVLVVLVTMLAYRLIRILIAFRSAVHGTLR